MNTCRYCNITFNNAEAARLRLLIKSYPIKNVNKVGNEMNWKQIKSLWQKAGDERWVQHLEHHLKNKKQERQNKKASK